MIYYVYTTDKKSPDPIQDSSGIVQELVHLALYDRWLRKTVGEFNGHKFNGMHGFNRKRCYDGPFYGVITEKSVYDFTYDLSSTPNSLK